MLYRHVAMMLAAVGVVSAAGLVSTKTESAPERTSIHLAGREAGPKAKLNRRNCGVSVLPERDVDLYERMAEAEAKRLGLKLSTQAEHIGTISVVIHCIYVESPFGDIGLITEADAIAQVDALNAAFDNVTFQYVDTTFTNNQDWYLMTPGSSAELAAKTALGWDTSEYLNIYTCDGNGLLGWATFPWERRRKPTLDGVVVAFNTLPGGDAPYDEGDTAIHEVGHWAGLYHTFQGGCSRKNDRVADTPAEAEPNYGCPATRDTCPSAGLDPINNFMDYSDDICLNNFTELQFTRMNQFLQTFRPSILIPTP